MRRKLHTCLAKILLSSSKYLSITNQLYISHFMKQYLTALIILSAFVSPIYAIYYTSCTESATRLCTYGTNVTDKLLSLKKGGSNVLSTNNYDNEFY